MGNTVLTKKQKAFVAIYVVLKSCIIVPSILIVLFIVSVYLCALSRLLRIPFLPTSQTNTKWQSEDETIYFFISENTPDVGEAVINGEKVEFVVRGGSSEGAKIFIYNDSILEDDTLTDQFYETWDIDIKSKKKFVATIEETRFSPDRVGKKITFYRIDEPDG